MMAFGHAMSGWCTALMIINALALFHEFMLVALLLLATGCAMALAGASILPDWDHPNSTISTAFGPFSKLVHRLVIELHYTVCSVTSEAGIKKLPGPHRGVTHWWPFPLVFGGLVALGSWWNKWVMLGVLVVLFTGAIRALTVPDYQARKTDTVRHRWSMETAHGIVDTIPVTWPFILIGGVLGATYIGVWVALLCAVLLIGGGAMWILKKARTRINRTYRIGGYWTYVLIPVGKIGTVLLASTFALIAIRFPYVTDNGVWLGVLVCIGMYVHILGDSPTEMGIPAFRLTRMWRLPKWLAFRAGGPFEILVCWIPMTALGIYLLPGLRPYEEVMMVQRYIVWGLVALAVIAVVIEFSNRYMKKKAWI